MITPSYSRRPVAEAKAIRHAVKLIVEAKHPLLLVGAGANRKRCCKMLRAFVDKTRIPFVTTQMGKGVVDENSDRFLGNAALSSGDFVHRAIDEADVIINVGHDVVEKPPFFMRAGGRRVIHVNYTSAEVDPVYFPQVEVIGDIANAVWQLIECLEGETTDWDFSRFEVARKHMLEHIGRGSSDDRHPMLPQRLVAEVRRFMPDDGIIALDNGMYKLWFARNYKAALPNTVLLDNALASMGAGLPSAMAAALVYPDRQVLAICGDGGYLMNAQELETAVRLKLSFIVLILNDSGYGMIKWKQTDMGFSDFGLDFTNPDFVKHAESYGARGHRVSQAGELGPLLHDCSKQSGVHIIDIPVDYSENHQTLNEEIQRLSSEI